ncbi:MAG: aldehyde dehydrogenase family protein [bacterium]
MTETLAQEEKVHSAETLPASTFHTELDRIFELQRENRYPIAKTSARERIEKLTSLLHLIYQSRGKIQDALYADFKKPAPEVDLTELHVATSEIKHAIKHLKRWMEPHKVKRTLAMLSSSAWIQYEARGAVLIISPWNFPFNLTMAPIISAIAAGNCIIVKPSEYSPNTSQMMKDLVEELFPENEIAFFLGDADVSSALLKKPFDHIFFTGSPSVGKIVMKAAAEHLTTVTLELGGKSPVIIDDSANIVDAAQKVAWGKYINNGQTCVAPDYIYVHKNVASEFIEASKRTLQHAYGASDKECRKSPDYARLISDRHFTRLKRLFDDTVKMGAQVEFGGETESGERYFAPTLLSGVSLESPAMQEEIFGPVLPILTFDSTDAVLKVIQSKPKPLALYIFSRNKKNIAHILSNTSAGSTCINDVAVQFSHLNLPFGGVNNSGFGSTHGFYGFKAFSHERSVLKQSSFSPLKYMYPPYTRRAKRFIDILLRYV